MWFGTKDGLNRFDGYQFKTYRHDADRPGSLGNDLVYALHYDIANRLWVGTNRGIYLYIPETEKFLVVKGTEGLRINDIKTDHNGNLWFISIKRTYIFEIASAKLSQLKSANFDATSVSVMQDGSVWITTMQGTLEQYNVSSGQFRSHYVMSRLRPTENSWVSCALDIGSNEILIGTANQGIKRFNRNTGYTKELLTFNPDKTSIYVRQMIRVSDQEQWIATESGIYVCSKDKITRLKKDFANQYSVSDNAIYSLFKDRERGIWAGTYFGGINYCSSEYSIFTKYFPQKGVNAISGSAVREITKDKQGNLWIGTEDAGLNQLEIATGKFRNYLPDGKSGSLSYSNIHGLLIDQGKLWIGTFEHGLDIMDLKSKKVIRHYTHGKGNGLKNGFILSFCKTKSGEILLATIVGLYRYDRKKDNFSLIEGLPFISYTVITQDSEGKIWAGTFNHGAVVFDLKEKGYIQYQNLQHQPSSISHNTVNGIFEDSMKQIWITTDGGGLNRYKKISKNFERITVKDGLPSNFLFKIIEDEDQKLWITSSRGLIHFDPIKKNMQVYSSSNGLLSDQFNYNSGFKDDDGQIYFG
ncbi:MAG: hybrid sensor histidine kinase/response regulator, partial [Chitinophagaceae bacterium]